jgi:hypothetical protein
MNKAHRVLIIIATAICLVEVAAILVTIIEPVSQSPPSPFASQALPRLLVYWLGGALALLVGIEIWKKLPLFGNSLGIGGVYLMLLGNNGGLFARGYDELRLAASILTLIILAFLAVRLDKQRTT